MAKIVNKEEKKSELTRLTIELLAKKGYERTTIQDIANHAGIGKGTFYEYFKSKDEVLEQVTREFQKNFITGFNRLFETVTDPVQQLRLMIKETMTYAETEEDLMKVYMEVWSIIMRGERIHLKKLFDELLEQWRNIVARIIEDGRKIGQFRDHESSYDLACFIIAVMDGIGIHYINQKDSFDLSKITGLFNNILSAYIIQESA